MSAELLCWILGLQRVPSYRHLLLLTSSLETTQRKCTWVTHIPPLPQPHVGPEFLTLLPTFPAPLLLKAVVRQVRGCSLWGLSPGSAGAGSLQDISSGSDRDPERPRGVQISGVRTPVQYSKETMRRFSLQHRRAWDRRSLWEASEDAYFLEHSLRARRWCQSCPMNSRGASEKKGRKHPGPFQGESFSLVSHTAGSSMTKLFFEERFPWPKKKKKKILEIFVDARDWISMSAIFSPWLCCSSDFLMVFLEWNHRFRLQCEISKPKSSDIFSHKCVRTTANERTSLGRRWPR